MKPITVVLVEDHTVVLEGLRAVLKAESDIEVIGDARNGRAALALVKELLPAVVVMDIAMPLLNGVEATRQILHAVPATKVLILSAYGDDEYVDQVVALGARGYLIKQSSAEVLAKAIRELHKGKMFFSPAIAKRLGDRERVMPKGRVGLSSREVEILQLVAEGKANKQMALELGISIKTVEKHRQRLMGKLGIHDTAGLTRYAIAAGIIERGVRLTIE
ncbi:MAG TPA: response regulator transcription factor [Candidatus Polarisedimenticolaceae bacterium]|nr:response regulator transcription factor [Candidatus Polarisedimenticolaceae bacterium]